MRFTLIAAVVALLPSIAYGQAKGYARAAPSVVQVVAYDPGWLRNYGAGVQVEGGILVPAALVDNRVVAIRYHDAAGEIRCRVTRSGRRLALLEPLDADVVAQTQPARLGGTPRPGQPVFSISHELGTGTNFVPWSFAKGYVRQVRRFDGEMLLHSTLHGGGPLFDRRGRLVGLPIWRESRDAVDVAEIKAFLEGK